MAVPSEDLGQFFAAFPVHEQASMTSTGLTNVEPGAGASSPGSSAKGSLEGSSPSIRDSASSVAEVAEEVAIGARGIRRALCYVGALQVAKAVMWA